MTIEAWLGSLGLGQYAELFVDNAIDQETLTSLTDAELKTMGVKALGHRKKLLVAIAALKASPTDKASVPLPIDLERFPSVLAIPLAAYASEADPLVRLWCICETVELTLRTIVALGIADVLGANKGQLPESLRAELAAAIDEPTLGQWRAMARCLARHCQTSTILPELSGFVMNALEPLLRGPESITPRIEDSLSELRNQLAHGGGVTRPVARRLLSLHAPRFEEALRAGAWLGDLEFVVPRAGQPPGVLIGPSPRLRPFHPVSDDVLHSVEQAARGGDAVVVVRRESVMALWPFHLYGIPRPLSPDAFPAHLAAPQIYARRGEVRLLLTPLGSFEVAQSTASEDALQSFEALFRHRETAPSARWTVAGWESELRRDAAQFVGRQAEVLTILQALANTNRGVLWLTGAAGIGKTFLMASVASELLGNPGDREIILPFRFRVGDGRCSRDAFLRFACERLRTWLTLAGDHQTKAQTRKPIDELRDLLGRVGEQRVVFLLDGLDEIAGFDPTFAAEIPLALSQPGVVWLCCGRPERGLPEAFALDRCRHLFEDGVPRMGPTDVREMLMRKLGFLAGDLLRSDLDQGEGVENPFVTAVTKYADGLPIYVKYVIGDILDRRIQVFDERARLPPSLEEYHHELLRRCTVGSLQMLLTPLVCLLAVAYDPLTDRMLHWILSRWLRMSSDQDGLDRVREGVGAVSCMLRRASTAAGDEGYRLFHDSLRQHMEKSPATCAAMTDTRGVMADLAVGWEEMPRDTPLVDYLARWGLAHCVAAGRADEAPNLAAALARTLDHSFIKGLIAGIYDLAPGAPEATEAVLRRLKTEPNFGARYACLMYYTWRLPTPIAQALKRQGADQAERDARRFSWTVIEVIGAAMQFTSVLAVADCLSQTKPPEAGIKLPDLKRPTLGTWAAIPAIYYRESARRGLPVALELLQRLFCEKQRDLERTCSRMVHYRNDFFHRRAVQEEADRDRMDDVWPQVNAYFEAIQALVDGQLLLFEERLDARRCRFRVLVGPDPSSTDRVDFDCSIPLEPLQLLFRMGESLVVLPPLLLCRMETDRQPHLLLFHGQWNGACHYHDLTSRLTVEIAAQDAGLARVWEWLGHYQP